MTSNTYVDAKLARLAVNCDACGFQEDVPVDDVMSWAGKPCPSCGHTPIVTEEACTEVIESMRRMQEGLATLNSLLGAMFDGTIHEATEDTPIRKEMMVKLRVNNDGTGVIEGIEKIGE